MVSFRFGCFELDAAAGQLRKRGSRLRLRDQSVRVLTTLVEHTGEVVSRDDLCRLLWAEGITVDFENDLNTVVGRLREVLGDSASHPKFIETLPRRGYRFIGKVVEERGSGTKVRLLVLPFVNSSGDPSQEYFSDAVTDEVITALASIAPQALAVIARATAMRFRGPTHDIAAIGRLLGVDHVVEGSVRRDASGHLILNVQLVRVHDQLHVFARRYSGAADELLQLQAHIASDLAVALDIVAPPSERVRERRRTSNDLVAYNEYCCGRSFMPIFTPASLDRARRHLESAVERDPKFALAYDSLAEVYWWIGYLGFQTPINAFTAGSLHAMRALEIDNGLGETHALLAQYHKQLNYDWPAVRREMAIARKLSPESPVVISRYAINELMPQGRLDEAVTEMERALELDPLSGLLLLLQSVLLVLSRRFDETIDCARRALEIEPNAYWPYLTIGSAYREMGQFENAVETHRKALDLSGGTAGMIGWLGMSLAYSGRRDEARELLERLDRMSAAAYVPPSAFAWIYCGLHEVDAAFEWMGRAIDARDQLMMPIKSYAFLDPFRSDPRFGELLRKMRLN